MKYAVRGLGVAASLAFVSTIAPAPRANAQSNAAYVYIQIDGSQGAVYGFTSSSSGKITAIPGAPWKPTGAIIGDNKSQFITLGEDNIHSYTVESNGAIGAQLEQNPYTDYSGGNCGTGSSANNNAVLDHSGKYVYILLQTTNGATGCSSVQSFNINSAGAFDGVGYVVMDDVYNVSLPTILGAETFAYANADSENYVGPIGFLRGSGDALYQFSVNAVGPTLSGGSYTLGLPDASPTANFVVFQLFPNDANPFQLGSYSVNSQGGLTTTNTSSNMPTSALLGASSTFSPSGNLYALYATSGYNQEGQLVPGGIELYNFNGASPLTLNTKLLTGTSIDQVAWDSSNHMYAISKSANMLYVYTVTPTSVTQDTAWSIGGPAKMIVVSTSASSSNPTVQFSDPLIDQSGTVAVGGQVTIDTTGNTTVELTGQAANSSYTAEFCPATANSGSANPPACFNITKVSTNSSGSGSTTVKFPQSGDWAGEFFVNNSNGVAVVESGLFPNLANETYMSALLPATKTNGGAAQPPSSGSTVQDTLNSGSVSYTNGNLLFTVNGAAASSTYAIAETEGGYLDSSSSYDIGSLATGSNGDGSTSINLANTGSDYGDMFQVARTAGPTVNYAEAGFIGGFSIP